MKRLFWCFFVLLCAASALFAQKKEEIKGPPNNEQEFEAQYQERIKQERLFGVYIPKNLEDALKELDKKIAPEYKEKIKALPEDKVCEVLHNRLGAWMILNWGFYEGSRFSHYLRSAGVTFPDDMADLVLLAYHRRLHGKPIEIKPMALAFKEMRQMEWRQRQQEGAQKYEQLQKAQSKPSKPAAKPSSPAKRN